MRRICLFLGGVLALSLGGIESSWAQRTSDLSMMVLANNQGIFECTINLPIFDFGNVNADGASFGTPNVVAGGRNGAGNGGSYMSASGSVTWTCRAAPSSTATIALVSTATDHTFGGMPANNLELRIPGAAGGTSTGYQLFTSQAVLINDVAVGNGTLAATGNLDLRLNVRDNDPTGANIWVARLRATGSP